MAKSNSVKELLEKHNVVPNVLLDQNFMVDEKFLKKLVSAADIKETDSVVEVGAGVGTIAKLVENKCRSLTLIELDEALINVLRKEVKNARVIHGDALKEIHKFVFNKLISNLPYSICEPFTYALFKQDFDIAVLTVPEGFAEKLINKSSSFALFANSFFDIKKIAEVPKTAFHPVPKVGSVIIKLTMKKELSDADCIMKQLWLQRDKKLKNALREAFIEKFDITKKEAVKKIEAMHLSKELLGSIVSLLKLQDLMLLQDALLLF